MKALIFFCLLGFSIPTVFCQTKLNPSLPLSPTAAAIGKYGDIDVSLYTGQINPSSKLFNIQLSDFSFPINLNYASSGLKVQETPSSVGMGWSLSNTGVITRQVRSVPDEQQHGYNGLAPTATIIQSINNGSYLATTAYQSFNETTFKRNIGEVNFDGEPDLFNFSFLGNGGKFFFDETQINSSDKVPVLIPKQPLRISAKFNYNVTGQLFNTQNKQGRIESFIVYDSQGNKYTFDKQEGALINEDDYQYGKNIVSTWYMTKIETPLGNRLDFKYIQRQIDLPHTQSEYQYLFESSSANMDMNRHSLVSKSSVTETVLQEISINNGTLGKIEFVEETSDRYDWKFTSSTTKPKALKEISLKDGLGNIVRKFVFNYEPGKNRLLLRSVQEYGTSGTGLEPHVFDYYNESQIPNLPSEGSDVISQEDHWGYYNNNTSGKLIPDFQSQNASGINTYIFTATNRNPDFNSALIGQLKKITYPTKGYSEFIYEANSYYSKDDDNFNPCSGTYQSIGAVTKTFTTSELCPSAKSTDFTITEGGYSCIKVDWSINLNSPNQDIIDGNVFIINNQTGAIYSEHTLSCNNGATKSDGGSSYVVLPPGNYSAKALLCREVPGVNTSVAKIEVKAIPTNANGLYSTKTSGGVRIKEVQDCPNPNSTAECLIKEYIYTSEDNNNSSGRIVTKAQYAYPIQYLQVSTDPNVYFNVKAYYVNSASQLPLSTTLGQYIGYNTVIAKEAKVENNLRVYKGKTVYDFVSPDINEVPDFNSSSFPFWSISNDWKRGVIEQIKMYDGANNLLKKEQNVYAIENILNYSKYNSIKSGKFIHNTEAIPNSTNVYEIYLFSKYLSRSGFQFNQQKIQQEYNSN